MFYRQSPFCYSPKRASRVFIDSNTFEKIDWQIHYSFYELCITNAGCIIQTVSIQFFSLQSPKNQIIDANSVSRSKYIYVYFVSVTLLSWQGTGFPITPCDMTWVRVLSAFNGLSWSSNRKSSSQTHAGVKIDWVYWGRSLLECMCKAIVFKREYGAWPMPTYLLGNWGTVATIQHGLVSCVRTLFINTCWLHLRCSHRLPTYAKTHSILH